jgi:hypothetical protein
MVKFLRENTGLSGPSQNATVEQRTHTELVGGDNVLLKEVIGRSNGEPAFKDEL